MKNILKLILVATSLLLVLVSCKEETVNTEEADIAGIRERLEELDATENTIAYSKDGENILDADYMEYYFGDPALLDGIEDYVYYTSATTSVNEIGVFKFSDEGVKEELLKAFANRIETLASTFALYSKEDEDVALGYDSGSVGNAVYFVATKDNLPVIEAIRQ